jgi:CheY-like chemotaxis protein
MSLNKTPRRCIIADDLRASRLLLEKWLTECGYVCESTVNGEQAWKAIVRQRPDLVVTDIEMPGSSGLDLLCTIRKHASQEIRSIPVIVISSLADGEIRKVVHDMGGTLFLPKPLERESTQRMTKELGDFACDFSDNEILGISPTLRRLHRDAKNLEAGPP